MEFRHLIANSMADHWRVTWHEDGGISPGVPDLHYVMLPLPGQKSHHVGWLELKAMSPTSGGLGFHVEPSQHVYIQKWCIYMPIHFCIYGGGTVYLVLGECHSYLSACKTIDDIRKISIAIFDKSDIGKVLPYHLRKATTK